MADILNSTAWSETDASNNSGTLPSFPENMPAKDLNNAARASQGALKRFANQINFTKVSTGTAAAYVLTYTVAPESIYDGQRFCWSAHLANSANPTVSVNGTVKTLRKIVSGTLTDLGAGEIGIGTPIDMYFRSSLSSWIWTNPPPPSVAGVPDASTTAKGVIEIATRAEVMAGASTILAMTPDTYAASNYKGADEAGGTTISLDDGGTFIVTGTSFNCTSIVFTTASASGRKALLIFSGSGGVLVNGANLKLPSGANITVAAGDTCEIVQESSGVYKVYNYLRASGQALVVGAVAVFTDVYKASDTSKTSNTTLAADPHLFFTVKAGKTYNFRSLLSASSVGGGGFKIQFVASTALARMSMLIEVENSVDGTMDDKAVIESTTSISWAFTTARGIFFIEGVITGGAADSVLSLHWAQSTSNVNATTLQAESYFSYLERP